MFEGLKCLFRSETLAVPLYIFCFFKILIPIRHNDSNIKYALITLIRPALTIILAIPFLIALLLFAIYFDIVHYIAKIKYGNKYADYFQGADAMWTQDLRNGKGIIHAVYFLEEKGPNTSEELMHTTKQAVKNILRLHPRLRSVRERFMGYFFFVKDDIDVSEIVTYLDDYRNEKEFNEVLSQKFVTPMPRDNKFMWEVWIGKHKLQHESGKLCYPIVCRIHHCVADGVTCVTLLITSLIQNGVATMRGICEDYRQIFKSRTIEGSNNNGIHVKSEDKPNILKFLIKLRELFNTELYFNYNMIDNLEKPNLLHRTTSNRAHLTMHMNKNDDTMGKIKAIKNKLKVSFNDVYLGVLSASFTEHYTKYDHLMKCPKHIISGNPFFLRGTDFNELATVTKNNEVITKLGNKFTMGFLKLPINEQFLIKPEEFVYAVNKETKSCKGSLDFQLIHYLFNVVASIVPKEISKPFTDFFDMTACISNIPALPALWYCNGNKIVDMVLYSHHYFNVGTTMTLVTYDNHLRLSMMIDKAFVEDEQQVHRLHHDFYKYLNLIYDSVVVK